MPLHDAVFCVDAKGCPCVWRPWDNKTLVQLPDTNSSIEWLATSGDESKLLTKTSDGGIALWDSSNGKFLRQLAGGSSPYLTDVNTFDLLQCSMALSWDGAKLAMLRFNGELILWDITGPVPRILARRSTEHMSMTMMQ